MTETLPPHSGDPDVITPADLVGRTVTCLLTNGIALVCIRVEALEPYLGKQRLVYTSTNSVPSASRVGLDAIGHIHVHGTANDPDPVWYPSWYVQFGASL